MHISYRNRLTIRKLSKLEARSGRAGSKQLPSLLSRMRRYRKRLIVAGLFSAVGLSNVCAQDCSIGDEQLVNSFTNGSQNDPDIAKNANGNYVIAWSGEGAGDAQGIFAQRYSRDGNALGAQIQVNTTTANDQSSPAVAIAPNDEFVVTWQSDGQDGDGYGIYVRRYAFSGLALTGEIQVNDAIANSQTIPAIATASDGSFVVAWQSNDGSNNGIFMRRFSSSAVPISTDIQVNTFTNSSQTEPAIAMDGDGDFVIAWSSFQQDGNASGVYAQRFNASGSKVQSEFKVNTYITGTQSTPSAAMDLDGNFIIAWHGNGPSSDGWDIFAQRYQASGSPIGNEIAVNLADSVSTVGYQSFPDVAMDADGDFVIVWTGYDGGQYGCFGRHFDSDGDADDGFQLNTYTIDSQRIPAVAIDDFGLFTTVWGSDGQDGSSYGIYSQQFDDCPDCMATTASDNLVNTHFTNSQSSSEIAMDAQGNYVVVWSSFGQDGSDRGIYAQRFAVDGTAQGSEFRVNTYTTGRQDRPDVAMDQDGDFVIVWQSNGQDGSFHGIYTQRYDATGTAQGVEMQVNIHTSYDQTNPAVAIDAQGDFVIAWQSVDFIEFPGISYMSVYARQYTAAGTAIGGEIPMLPGDLFDQDSPTVASDADGNFVVCWRDRELEGIYAKRFDANGVVVQPNFRVNSPVSGSSPEVAMEKDGGFAVTWVSPSGLYTAISAKVYNASGNVVQAEFLVDAEAGRYLLTPDIGMDDDGDFIITWSSRYDYSSYGIFAQQYQKSGIPKEPKFQANNFHPTDYFQGSPAVAMDADGDFVFTWTSLGPIGDSYDIYRKSFDCCIPAFSTITGNQLMGTLEHGGNYEADVLIESIQSLDGGHMIYDAGQCIELLPGFEAAAGTTFEAVIGGCEN